MTALRAAAGVALVFAWLAAIALGLTSWERM